MPINCNQESIKKKDVASLISVGMPLYNAEKYLEQSLDCLLRQTYSQLEIIISDNGSTDKTMQIVKDYAARDSRIKIFEQPENIGPIPNFHFVLAKATGNYFMWRSYDDWSDDTYIEELCSVLDENKEIDLAIARIIQSDGNTELGETKLNEWKPVDGNVFSTAKLLRSSHPSWIYGLFRREEALHSMENAIALFPHVWGCDHLILFPFVSQNRVMSNTRTRFFQRITGMSSIRYRPKLPRDQVRLATDFYTYCLKIILRSDRHRIDKIALVFYLLSYTNSCTEKFTRILRIALGLRRP
jgi:glycosyltransferase involved in cell wall biosynthesis